MFDTLYTLNWMDYCCMACIGCSTIIGLSKGLVKELSSLANWIIATWLGFLFYQPMSTQLPDIVQPQLIRFVLGFLVIFVIILVLGTLLNSVVSWLIRKTGLSGFDRLLGLVFGLARGTLLVGIAMLLIRATPLSRMEAWKTSLLLPYLKPLENWLRDFVVMELE